MEHFDEKNTEREGSQEGRSRRSAIVWGSAALAGLAFGSRALGQAAAPTDNDILNFALNLEFLEAQFYTLATTGMTLDQAGISTKSGAGAAGGTVTVKSGASSSADIST